MSLPPLTIVPAGAGSGKTYRIQQTLGEWVERKLVQPERIVAVTFTEAAAAELRSRIRAKLLDLGRPDDALKLDQAYISTIHSFGLRLLTEFAFDAGISPRPRLLSEDEENALIRSAIAKSEQGDPILEHLSRFGYKFDFVNKKGAEDNFRGDVLTAIQRLRMIGQRAGDDSLVEPALNYLKTHYGKPADEKQLNDALAETVKHMLHKFPASIAGQFASKVTVRKAFENDFANLKLASQIENIESDWAMWQGLRGLRMSKRGSPTPEGYDELAGAVIHAADALPRHPGPLKQAITHTRALLASAEEVLAGFAKDKRQAGLLDYSDMITLAWRLLLESDQAVEALGERVDCVVIDEFQDTNPIQFALLWQLHRAGIPAMIVGDIKQAIMGFQGADSRLFTAVERQHAEQAEPLTDNWRSDPQLMAFINRLGTKLFPDEYQVLTPQVGPTNLEPIEVMRYIDVKGRGSKDGPRAWHLGQRLEALLSDESQQVMDRMTKKHRRLRAGDIAILCPTHKMLGSYAEQFRGLGLRVRLSEEGWFQSRAVQLVIHSLQYVANPRDRHAALYVAVTELGNLSLEAALGQLIEYGQIKDPVLTKLDPLCETARIATVGTAVAQCIAVLGLHDIVAGWPDGEQARANLLRLEAEALEFMEVNRETLNSGGYYGAGIPTFLSWLESRAEADDSQPDPRVNDDEAIELVTWHAAKGREWPVVVVAGTDYQIGPRLPSFEVGYENFANLDKLLDGARIEYSAAFAAPETNEHFIDQLQHEDALAKRRLLYVALTRAREKLILEWPDYLEGKDKATYWSLLSEECGVNLADNEILVGDDSFPCHAITSRGMPSDDVEGVQADGARKTAVIGRRAIRAGASPEPPTPDSLTPSTLHSEFARDIEMRFETYGEGLEIQIGLPATQRGTFLHQCFEVLAGNPAHRERFFLSAGVELGKQDQEKIVTAVGAFESWLQDNIAPVRIEREWPVLAMNEAGSVLSGVVDLLVETESGTWVIDHKSDQCDDYDEQFKQYLPQLQAYAAALSEVPGRPPIAGLGINWLHRGCFQSMKS